MKNRYKCTLKACRMSYKQLLMTYALKTETQMSDIIQLYYSTQSRHDTTTKGRCFSMILVQTDLKTLLSSKQEKQNSVQRL